jgi:hypothetical protein
MATVEDRANDCRYSLGAQTTLGRSRRADLRVDRAEVSGRHALIRWVGDGWELRDLGSSNGTFHNGTRLEPGEVRRLGEGDRFGLGAPEGWLVRSVAPPVASAMPADGGAAVIAEAGMLSLPPGEAQEITVLHTPEGWVIERDGEVGPAPAEVEVAGRLWRLHLPEVEERTLRVSATPSVGTIGLRFEVSADEEYARMVVLHDREVIPLEERVYHYLLLTLARRREADRAEHPEAACGWVHQEDLARMLRIEENQVNVQIYRARKQLAAAGVDDAARLVERRTSNRSLRIGVERLEVVTV